MRRGTTPTLTLTTSQDMSTWTCVLTLQCPTKSIDLEGDRLTFGDKCVIVHLTQEETIALRGNVEIQLRATKDGEAVASDIVYVSMERILKEGVLGDE